jgi:hypothetical protein
VRGFPTLMYMDADGKKLTEPGGRDVASFASTAKALSELSELKARIEKGEKGLDGKLLATELALGSVDYPAAKERLAKIKKLDDATKAKIVKLMVDAEVTHLFASAGRDPEKVAAAQERLVAMLKEGKIPTGRSTSQFWNAVMQWAETHKDVAIFERAVNAAKAQYADEPRAKAFLENLDKKLAEMKEAAKVDPKP